MAESRGVRGLGWGAPGRAGGAVLAGVMVLGLAGCNTLGLSRSPNADDTMANQYVERGFRRDTLVSRLQPVQLRLAHGWRAAPTGSLHPNADLEAHNLDQTMFLVVLGENRTAVAPGNLEDQATFYLQILKGGFDQVLGNQARTSIERIDGFPAVQYEVQGIVAQQPVAYLHTTIEMGDHYYQVVVWTPENLRVANAEAMRTVVQEFREAQL